LGLAVGYDIDYNSFSLSPYGRLNYAQNNVNSYTEKTVSGDPGLSLNYRKQEAKSFTSALGTQASYARLNKERFVTGMVSVFEASNGPESLSKVLTAFPAKLILEPPPPALKLDRRDLIVLNWF